MITILLATVLPWLLIAVGIWLVHQLVLQNGRILLRLESIEQRLSSQRAPAQPSKSAGLPIGSAAPDFDLPDLTGKRHKLSDFRERNVLLLFFNPQCGFCTKMAANLAALPADGGPDRVVTIVVTTGDADENRKLVEQHRIRSMVLLQEEMKVAAQYQAQGTPMGYRIDAAGRIAGELAVGAEPVLKLAGKLSTTKPIAGKNGSAKEHHHPDPSLARSKINRSGLTAGTVAPDFRLPGIDGGEMALGDFRGKRLLLVFSDPNCGPCDELAPDLQQIHAQREDLQVLLISRRDIEATRLKATSLGLSFPIVMQKQWEVSLQYGMFATPIAYLIDEQGVLLSDVAVGVEPILVLAGQPVPKDAGVVAMTS